jgi:hypothetical protein
VLGNTAGHATVPSDINGVNTERSKQARDSSEC